MLVLLLEVELIIEVLQVLLDQLLILLYHPVLLILFKFLRRLLGRGDVYHHSLIGAKLLRLALLEQVNAFLDKLLAHAEVHLLLYAEGVVHLLGHLVAFVQVLLELLRVVQIQLHGNFHHLHEQIVLSLLFLLTNLLLFFHFVGIPPFDVSSLGPTAYCHALAIIRTALLRVRIFEDWEFVIIKVIKLIKDIIAVEVNDA
mmetsp:Transcript_23109/g.22518  ORF Transcript_23109/g.22518 Transcript_23109/m.22518 type:complete len:200 (+) Transcript_23109:84-683(+)